MIVGMALVCSVLTSQTVDRGLEGILEEYGHSKFQEPDRSFHDRSEMFRYSLIDLEQEDAPKSYKNAGWLSKLAFEGLVKRMTHAIMTEDSFNVVLGGHSAAAGHGNHFQQSYTLQIAKILEPIFARLGVKMEARNFAMGGLGTLQSSMAAGDIYGRDIDVLIWDSGMTEGDQRFNDVFRRQGIISGNKVPVLIGGQIEAQSFQINTGAEMGSLAVDRAWSDNILGIPQLESMDQMNTIPWAAISISCSKDLKSICKSEEYRGICWLNRTDFTPNFSAKSPKEPGGRAGWHPGDRKHQFTARTITFGLLTALKEALTRWSHASGFELTDDDWHLDAHYREIQRKVVEYDQGLCHKTNDYLSSKFCKIPIQGRTEFTPHYKGYPSSLRSIIKDGVAISPLQPNAYDPPDVYNPNLHPPPGVFDVLAVLEDGVPFAPDLSRRLAAMDELGVTSQRKVAPTQIKADIVPGKGFGLETLAAPDNCDGTYDSFCNRLGEGNACPLYAHNDNRGGVRFDSLSGWMVLNLEKMKHGYIMLKIEDWHPARTVSETQGWSCIDNDCEKNPRRLSEHEDHRKLGKPPVPDYCASWAIDIAIDGKISTWDKDTWMSRYSNPQRVVQVWEVMDDPDFLNGETRDVEFGFRMRGCDREKVFQFTHIYWA